MKKVIMSAIIGAIFGGAVVAFSTNNNFVNIAEAKGQPEMVKNYPEIVKSKKNENEQVDNDEKIDPNLVLAENQKFYFNVNDNLIIFNIIKSTISNLEFELTFENKNDNSKNPVMIKGKAENSQWEWGGAEPLTLPDENDSNHMLALYQYKSNDCSFNISYDHSEIGNYSDENLDAIFIDNMECKKLTDVGFKNAYVIAKNHK